MSKMGEKVAYLKGLAEGLGVTAETEKGKLMLAMIDTLEAFAEQAEETEEALAADEATRAEEVGDLLFAAVNVARKCGVDPERALSDATDKFIDRFAAVEDAVRADGKRMEDLPLSVLDTYWDRVKANRNGENT